MAIYEKTKGGKKYMVLGIGKERIYLGPKNHTGRGELPILEGALEKLHSYYGKEHDAYQNDLLYLAMRIGWALGQENLRKPEK